MAEGISIKLDIAQFNAIDNALKQLPIKVQTQLIRSVNRKVGTREIIKPLRSILPYSSKTTENIKAQADRSDKLAINLGPTYDIYFLRFLERGTISRGGKKRKNIPGQVRMRPRPIIEPFVDSKINSIINYYNKEMGNDISKFLQNKIRRLK